MDLVNRLLSDSLELRMEEMERMLAELRAKEAVEKEEVEQQNSSVSTPLDSSMSFSGLSGFIVM